MAGNYRYKTRPKFATKGVPTNLTACWRSWVHVPIHRGKLESCDTSLQLVGKLWIQAPLFCKVSKYRRALPFSGFWCMSCHFNNKSCFTKLERWISWRWTSYQILLCFQSSLILLAGFGSTCWYSYTASFLNWPHTINFILPKLILARSRFIPAYCSKINYGNPITHLQNQLFNLIWFIFILDFLQIVLRISFPNWKKSC